MLLILIMPIILPFSRTGAFLIWFSVRIWQTLAQFHFRADGNDLFFRDIPYLHCHELLCAFLEIRQLLQGGGIDKQRLHIRKEAQDIPI